MTYTPVLDRIFRRFGSRRPEAKPLKERIFDVERELRRLERQVSLARDEGSILMARSETNSARLKRSRNSTPALKRRTLRVHARSPNSVPDIGETERIEVGTQ